MAKQRRHSRVTTQRILGWADAHYKRTGRWPTNRSGRVHELADEDWRTIDRCLEFGGLGLPGGSSLNYLLARHRGLIIGKERPKLSVKLLLVWADRHRIRTGEYPTKRSGRVSGVRAESWQGIDSALRGGNRGLPGRSSLAQLLSKHRGKALKQHRTHVPDLTLKQILAWIDQHRARTGFWPTINAGPIRGHPEESWHKIDAALRGGRRGLRGRSSLPQLLLKRRGKMLRCRRRHLTVARILDWADQHRALTGNWPAQKDGPVSGVPGESWINIDDALRVGRGGLPGGSSLPTVLAKHRGRRHMGQLPRLTIATILAWADDHYRRTGKWPHSDSGPVEGVRHESWRNIDTTLTFGRRGHPPGSSLAGFLAEHRRKTPRNKMPKLSISRILRWADRHRSRTGDWPIETSGTVVDAPENTWLAINTALAKGLRGLPGGSSLARLLMGERGKRVRTLAPRLTVTQIKRWAKDHLRRTGDWPVPESGPVKSAPSESWRSIDNALRQGGRGLDGESSLTRLLAEHCGMEIRGRRQPRTRKRTSARTRTAPKRKTKR